MSYDLNAFNSEQWKQLLDTIKQGGGSSSGGITDEQIEELVEAIKSSKSVVASGEVGIIQDSLQWDDLVNSILGIDAKGITDTQIQSLVTAIEKTKTIKGTITNTHDSTQFERLIEAIESSGGSVSWDDITGKPSLLYPSDVINSLISTETEKPLSADRGRYLYDLILNEHTELGALSNLVGDGSEIAQIGDGTVCNAISELNSTSEEIISNGNGYIVKRGNSAQISLYAVSNKIISEYNIPIKYRPIKFAQGYGYITSTSGTSTDVYDAILEIYDNGRMYVKYRNTATVKWTPHSTGDWAFTGSATWITH